jgi:hypothetical protein
MIHMGLYPSTSFELYGPCELNVVINILDISNSGRLCVYVGRTLKICHESRVFGIDILLFAIKSTY